MFMKQPGFQRWQRLFLTGKGRSETKEGFMETVASELGLTRQVEVGYSEKLGYGW